MCCKAKKITKHETVNIGLIVWDMPPTKIRVCFAINMQCIIIVKSMGLIALIIKSLGLIALLIFGPWLKGEVGTSSAPPADLLSPQLLHIEIN